jgi:hypothetical protein
VVIDPSGEAAKACAAFRADTLGHNVAILDPFNVVKGEEFNRFKSGFNVLDLVKTSDDINKIAEGCLKRGSNESQPFFDETAGRQIGGLLAAGRPSEQALLFTGGRHEYIGLWPHYAPWPQPQQSLTEAQTPEAPTGNAKAFWTGPGKWFALIGVMFLAVLFLPPKTDSGSRSRQRLRK